MAPCAIESERHEGMQAVGMADFDRLAGTLDTLVLDNGGERLAAECQLPERVERVVAEKGRHVVPLVSGRVSQHVVVLDGLESLQHVDVVRDEGDEYGRRCHTYGHDKHAHGAELVRRRRVRQRRLLSVVLAALFLFVAGAHRSCVGRGGGRGREGSSRWASSIQRHSFSRRKRTQMRMEITDNR